MPSNHLRVATLNIWNRSGPWPERLRLIREHLRTLDPDLIGLEEVLRTVSPGTIRTAPVAPATASQDPGVIRQRRPQDAPFIAMGPRWTTGGAPSQTPWPASTDPEPPLSSCRQETRRVRVPCTRWSIIQRQAPRRRLELKLHHGAVRCVRWRRYVTYRGACSADDDQAAAGARGRFRRPDADEIRSLR
jgi:hypothetical protein